MTPLLEVRGAVKHFGGVPALDGIDLDVAAGEVVAIIGPNGAGKSTLLQVINGMEAPTRVDGIRLDGQDLVGWRPHRIRRAGIATVLQTPRMFEGMTVRDNAALGAMFAGPDRPRSSGGRAPIVQEVLDRLGLADRADADVGVLTLHDKRLLDLARALTGGPRLLLLDEVMAGLNPTEVDRFAEVIRSVRTDLGVAVVWVEHVMRAVTDLADRVVVLDAGRQIAHGTADEVLRHPRVIEAYLGQQDSGHAAG